MRVSLKASNILFDEDLHCKISDYGIVRIFVSNPDQANTKRVVGHSNELKNDKTWVDDDLVILFDKKHLPLWWKYMRRKLRHRTSQEKKKSF